MAYTTREFLDTVLPQSGYICFGRIRQGANGCKHDVYDSVGAAISDLRRDAIVAQDHYLTISTLEEASIEERGKKRVRTQSNAKLTRSFVLDMDIKETTEGFYSSKDEAFAGIQNICQALDMPDPIVVDSGYGYHVYWPMAAGVPSKEWQGVAKLFGKALTVVEPKAVADSTRVSDTAGLLRIPNTLNLKYGKKVPVRIVQWYDDFLDFGEFRDKLQRITGTSIKEDEPKANKPARQTLAVAEFGNEKVPLLNVMRNCNWMQSYARNKATNSEPEWYATLGLAPYMTHGEINGSDVAHMLSKGHPDYDAEATDIKFEQVKGAQNGPTTCERLAKINPKPCSTCPFRGAITTPLQAAYLSRPVTAPEVKQTIVITDDGGKEETQVVIPVPPSPYFRGESGGVYKRVKFKDKENEWHEEIVQVYDYDLYPVKRYRTEQTEEEHLELHLWLPRDGMRKFKMPAEMLADGKKMGTFLSSRGAVGEFGGLTNMVKYMIDYTRHMQIQEAAEVEYTRFGWRDARGIEPKFVVGNGLIDKDGSLQPAAFPAYLRSAATSVAQHGTLEAWKEAFGVYQQVPNSEAYIFTVMMGFAAPLMALTPYAGILYNMVGPSGAGKSAALSIMTSVWGVPTVNRVSITDTQISMYNTIGYLNSVPVAFDEITNMDPKAASEFALNFTGGRGKERAGRDGKNIENNTGWDTIVVSTSNTSMYSKLTMARRGYNAEAMRVFEVNVPPPNINYRARMDGAVRALKANYGVAGRAYIPHVIKHRDQLADLIDKQTNAILAESGASNAERFWATLVACVVIGGGLAGKIGLHTYDMSAVKRWALTHMGDARIVATDEAGDANALLGEFLNKHLDKMVHSRDGKPELSLSAAFVDNPRSIVGRLEYGVGPSPVTAIISSKALAEFCEQGRIDVSWLITELKAKGITSGIARPVRIASGTNLPNPTVRAYMFDMVKQAGITEVNLDGQPASQDQGLQGLDAG